ncbi:MAG: hypothetical protein ACP5LI_07775 [Hydrogenobaculum sp.]
MINKYDPPITFWQRLQHRRYAKLERELKPLCKWADFYDYIWSYGKIFWYDKVVLDIGADIGSSALFFLLNGASKVYLVEKEEEYRQTYRKLKEKYPLLQKTELIEPKDINKVQFDVLKMDCEGCEFYMLNEDLLTNSNEFVIGLHKPQLDEYQFEQKKRLIEKYGGRYYGSVNNEEFLFIKTIK